MFNKPFRIKAQTLIRNSDRKKIRADVSRNYPSLTDSELSSLFPNKEDMTTMKVFSHSGETVTVHCLKKNPIFFQVDKCVYPTVYTLWSYPSLLPAFTTYGQVVEKLMGGADLMLPGVVTEGEVTPETFKHVKKGDPCLVNTVENRAAAGVGICAMSGDDMYESGMRGKGIHMLHLYKDHLWAHGQATDPPQIPHEVPGAKSVDDTSEHNAAINVVESSNPSAVTNDGVDIDFNELSVYENSHGDCSGGFGASCEVTNDAVTCSSDAMHVSSRDTDDSHVDTCAGDGNEHVLCDQFTDTAETMDELLYRCFLCALKADVKADDLPLLSSKLLPIFMQPWCPMSRSLDLKKSSYKKLSKFLHAMVARELIVVKELSKGVESITEVMYGHPELKQFVLPDRPVRSSGSDDEQQSRIPSYHPPCLEEVYAVSGSTLPLFRHSGLTKGEVLDCGQVRRHVKDYITSNELTVDNDPRLVRLDAALCDALLNKTERDVTHLAWDQLFTRCMEKMTAHTRITYPGQPAQMVKGKLQPIKISIAQRAGNKKVTLIENLDQFGIDASSFAHQVQIGVAGSTAINPVAGKKNAVQVLVQGNQIKFVADLLLGKYGLNKKYISVWEKATVRHQKKQ